MKKVSYKATTKGKFGITGFNLVEWLEDICRIYKDMDLTITVQKRRKVRSSEQNRYYWGIVLPLVRDGFEELGDRVTNEQVHEFLKGKFLPSVEIVKEDTAEIVRIPGSTTILTTSQAMDYYAQIQQFAAEFLGVYIPDPNEQVKIEF